MPYREYLRTPEWQVRREAALERAGHRCQLDQRHATNLHVHHNTYDRRGDERPEDLIVLCDQCHGKHHGKPRRRAGTTSIAPPAPAPVPQPAARGGWFARLLRTR